MKKRIGLGIAVLAFAVTSTGLLAQAVKKINETLTGYEEVPAVSTTAGAEFSARINKEQTQIEWELSYENLQGAIQQSHIHFAQPGVNGGIVLFLCTNLGNGPAGTQPCGAPPATVSGTWTAADVTGGAAAQGIAAGEFDKVVAAIRAGSTYVNVHSTLFPGGEIRAQIHGGRGGH